MGEFLEVPRFMVWMVGLLMVPFVKKCLTSLSPTA